jgi:hypothetical protein
MMIFLSEKIDNEKFMSRIVQQNNFTQNGQLSQKLEEFEVSGKKSHIWQKHKKN